MNELDKVLDVLMEDKRKLIMEAASDEDRDELIASLRERKKKRIVEEIRKEYKEELLEEARNEAKIGENRQKIKDLKALVWTGFFLAFWVGLLVNQVTDIIGYYKGTVSADRIWPTMVIAGILTSICIIAYLHSFLENALTLIDDYKKDKQQENEAQS